MTSEDYPEDWREQGWCCRECGAMAWYANSLEVRRELLASMAGNTVSGETACPYCSAAPATHVITDTEGETDVCCEGCIPLRIKTARKLSA